MDSARIWACLLLLFTRPGVSTTVDGDGVLKAFGGGLGQVPFVLLVTQLCHFQERLDAHCPGLLWSLWPLKVSES